MAQSAPVSMYVGKKTKDKPKKKTVKVTTRHY